MVDPREQTLIDECLRGRVDAFTELVQPYQDRLFNVLYRTCGSRDDAAELLQDALIRAFHRLATFQGEASFYTWLYRIAMNLALTRRSRRKLRVRSMDATDDRDERFAMPVEMTEPGRRMEHAERQTLIEQALASVPEPFRAALILKELEGLKYEEIAAILNLPVGTVRSRLHRARSELRHRLKPLFEAGEL